MQKSVQSIPSIHFKRIPLKRGIYTYIIMDIYSNFINLIRMEDKSHFMIQSYKPVPIFFKNGFKIHILNSKFKVITLINPIVLLAYPHTPFHFIMIKNQYSSFHIPISSIANLTTSSSICSFFNWNPNNRLFIVILLITLGQP